MKVKAILVYRIFTLIFVIAIFQSNSLAQSTKIDSLKKIINTTKNDSIKVDAYEKWDELIYLNDPILDLKLNEKIKLICSRQLQKNKSSVYFKTKLSFAYNNLGNLLEYKGNYALSLEYHQKSLALATEINDKKRIASSYNNIGNLYKRLELVDKALLNYEKSLALRENMKDFNNQAIILNNIGLIYLSKDDYRKAEGFLKRCLAFNIPTSNNLAYLNLGLVKRDMNELDSSLIYFQKSFEIDSALSNKHGMVVTLNRWGHVCFMKSKELEMASEKSFAKRLQLKGLKLLLQALQLAEELNQPSEEQESHLVLSNIYNKNNQPEKAYYHLNKYFTLNEKLNSQEEQEKILRKDYKNEMALKNLKDSLKRIETKKINDERFKVQEAEIENEKLQKYFLYFGVLVLIVFGLFIYNRFKITKRQNLIIEKQKSEVEKAHDELEEKNNEIVDSINYAKRIQAAILPSKTALDETSNDNFILYKPKDIVAGDFYWIENIKIENEQPISFFAAADCTGHGVPGALVSVVCHNALNKALHEHQLMRPDLILNKTREIIIKEFEKGIMNSNESIKDGMDIALCKIQGNKLQFAGAHNPLWIIRNNELIEIKADKQPIGKFENYKDFHLNEFQLEKNDTLFIFTDGYQDQFGGVSSENNKPTGKKYKAARLKTLLLSIHHLPMKEQQIKIENSLEEWKGNLEQVDDICMIGVRV
jgi:serine phosphatase RsbU (regulator of sigma subunit)/Flp pilus assembly protein TadD